MCGGCSFCRAAVRGHGKEPQGDEEKYDGAAAQQQFAQAALPRRRRGLVREQGLRSDAMAFCVPLLCCRRDEDGLLPQHALEEQPSSPMSESCGAPLERAHHVRRLSSCSSNCAPPCSLCINEHDDDALGGLVLDQEADTRASGAKG